MKNSYTDKISNPGKLLQKLISYLEHEEYVVILDSCQLPSAAAIQEYEYVVAWGCQSQFESNGPNSLDELEKYHSLHQDWIFGGFSYDIKNQINSRLSSSNKDYLQLPDCHFFQAENVLTLKTNNELTLSSIYDPEKILKEINDTTVANLEYQIHGTLESTVSKDEYFKTIKRIKDEIREGNVYEINYCLNHNLELKNQVNPIVLYSKLREKSPAPYSAFYRSPNFSIISSSPERYLRKKGRMLVSQPIKGTRSRKDDVDEDFEMKLELQNSLKERAENVMIVDLVRNDLAHTSISGSIKVKELFGIYSYQYVHQMVSTVEAQLKNDKNWVDVLKSSYPMGSMTGAPKIAAMELIEELEDFKRGWYSGSVGYIDPESNFDFNVIIRSLIYNHQINRLNYSVGGAITYDSTASEEWEECNLKAKAIQALFS